MTTRESLLTVAEVAERFGVHPTTIQHWIKAGHFPRARKVGPGKNSPYRIPESDVDALEARINAPPVHS